MQIIHAWWSLLFPCQDTFINYYICYSTEILNTDYIDFIVLFIYQPIYILLSISSSIYKIATTVVILSRPPEIGFK